MIAWRHQTWIAWINLFAKVAPFGHLDADDVIDFGLGGSQAIRVAHVVQVRIMGSDGNAWNRHLDYGDRIHAQRRERRL